MEKRKVWDAPTRLFHWVIVGLVVFCWWTAENDQLDLHRAGGITLAAFLIFRIYWGFVGSETARFGNFLRGPKTVMAYVAAMRAGKAEAAPGHSPIGGWSVAAMLAAARGQGPLGLFAVDVDGVESGPLSHLVSFSQGRFAAETHETLFNVLAALIALHIAAVAFYLIVAKKNLVGPMITGSAKTDADSKMAPLWLALPGIVLAGGFAWALASGFRF